ncbi:hypothetical protein GCM10010253_67340 [Streptomyces badius]|uniref:Uncharacterized protein n=1 Tax=Streptomyces badius TaxID=1941 RepID=A0ABQ2TR30_STRBA|nr:hypothetical protein GCM10010253_67340 [Streptomyces badius]
MKGAPASPVDVMPGAARPSRGATTGACERAQGPAGPCLYFGTGTSPDISMPAWRKSSRVEAMVSGATPTE